MSLLEEPFETTNDIFFYRFWWWNMGCFFDRVGQQNLDWDAIDRDRVFLMLEKMAANAKILLLFMYLDHRRYLDGG